MANSVSFNAICLSTADRTTATILVSNLALMAAMVTGLWKVHHHVDYKIPDNV